MFGLDLGQLTSTLVLKDQFSSTFNDVVRNAEAKSASLTRTLAVQQDTIGKLATGMTSATRSIEASASATQILGSTAGQATSMLSGLAGPAILGGVVALGAGFAVMASRAAETYTHINDLSRATGLAASQIDRMSIIGQNAGAKLDQIGNAALTFNRKLVDRDKGLAGGLALIGESFDSVWKMNPATRFEQIAVKVGQIEGPAKRAAAAYHLLGSEDLSTFTQALAKAKDDVGQLTDEEIADVTRLHHTWESFLTSLSVMGGRAIGDVAKAVSSWRGFFQAAAETAVSVIPGGEYYGVVLNNYFRKNSESSPSTTFDLDQAAANADLLKQWQFIGGPAGIDPTKFDAATRANLAKMSSLNPSALGIDVSINDAKNGLNGPIQDATYYYEGLVKSRDQLVQLALAERDFAAMAQQSGTLTTKIQKDEYDALQRVIDEFGSLKAAGLGALQPIYEALSATVGATHQVNLTFDEMRKKGMAAVMAAQVDWAQKTTATMGALWVSGQQAATSIAGKVNLPTPSSHGHPSTLTQWLSSTFGPGIAMPGAITSLHDIASPGGPDDPYRGMPKTTPSGEFINSPLEQRQAFKFGTGISNTIVSAITSGGDAFGAAGSYAGQQIGAHIADGLKDSSWTKSALGSAFAGAIPVIGALAGPLLTSVVNVFKKGEYANDLRDQLKEKFGDAAGAGLQAFVDTLGNAAGVQQAYQRFMHAGSKEDVQKAFDDFTAAADKATSTVQKYGLSLDDLQSPLQRVTTLVGDATELRTIGFNDTQIGTGMADGLNAAIKAALDGQAKIPVALEPVLTAFVKGGGLADDLKNRILGLADPVPWQDMQTDAEFFGADLTQLGDKFNNAKWSSVIADAGDKFQFLIDNGANASAIIAGIDTNTNGVKDAIEGLVKSSLKFGTEIPANAKPMLQALADAGELTDDNGEKLTDLSKLTFGQDTASQFQIVIDKLGTLIDRLSGPNGLYATINGIPQPQINWPPLPGSTFTPEQYATYQSSIGDPTKGTWVGNQWVPNQSQTPGFASGSAGLQRFSAAGTVALLHGEEEVLTRTQSEGVARMVARALAQGTAARRTPTSVTHQWIYQGPDADGFRRLVRNPQFKREIVAALDDNPHDFGVDVAAAIDRRLPS